MGITRGAVPYKPNDAPDGTEHTLLSQEAKRLYHFIQGADNVTPESSKRKYVYSNVRGFA